MTVNKTLVNIATNMLLKKENIDDFSVAIGLAAILTGEIHELKNQAAPRPDDVDCKVHETLTFQEWI